MTDTLTLGDAELERLAGKVLEEQRARRAWPARHAVAATPPSREESLFTISPAEWQGWDVPPRRWTVEDYIPDRNVTSINGDGGLGKTLLGLQLLASTYLGAPWLGLPTGQGNALGVFCEDEDDELHRRMVDIAAHLECELRDLDGVHLVPRVGENNVLVEFDRSDRAKPTPFYESLTSAAVASGSRIVVLDSLHDLFGGNEISRPQARQFIGYLRRLALAIDGAVILTAHPSVAGINSGTGTSGSTAWHNAVRSRLYLTRPDDETADDDLRTLKTMKQNYGARREGIDLRWANGVLVPTGAMAGDPFREAHAAFLDCLGKVEAEGRYVSATKNSAAYAPTVFHSMAQSRRLGRARLAKAMEELFAEGKILIGEHVRPNRHRVNAIVRGA
jgi:RecA-family ATPase